MTIGYILAAGVLLNSAIYLVSVFVAGLILRNGVAWKLALVAMGGTFLLYMVQCVALNANPATKELGDNIAFVLNATAISLSVIAGLALIIWS